ncbi:protein FAR1-RELATED SEQUENCE 5-like [Lotus japonicus]|uniref:protein FAR1-RELATED SEQUENCE 5-like n=1 Tax=Lotus japonicus TaxID=34305 RepID=UPI00258E8830|nr:protein FAR1-RELATED SEQUENCE 5-like [Lotus japonicus]
MKGKEPSAVITDGDPAMRNAISRLLPEAHDRLCAWNLLQNAQRNVGDPNFVKGFKSDLNLEDDAWVQGMYEKRHMWATSLMRGKFFGGFRTTSRCEGMHSQIGRIVRSRNSLLEFVQYFERYVNYMRWREVDADYKSVVGDAVLQTSVRELEKSAADLYTRTVFLKFRPWLIRGSVMKVASIKETSSCIIYSMYKYCKPSKLWHVAHDESMSTFRCSCQRMESFGLPCDHIIALLVHLDIDVILESLVMHRWCKTAKECMKEKCSTLGVSLWKTIDTVDVMAKHVVKLKAKRDATKGAAGDNVETPNAGFDNVKNPNVVRSKGCGTSAANRTKVKRKCTVCKMEGHNKTTCTQNKRLKVAHDDAGCAGGGDA